MVDFKKNAYISETENEMITDAYTSGKDLLAAVEKKKAEYDIFICPKIFWINHIAHGMGE